MFAEQRKSLIIDKLHSKGSVSLPELMKFLNVSQATVRRDLTDLERTGFLKRTHGGAVSTSLSIFEVGYAEKENEYLVEKQSIANLCSNFINDGDSVLLDSGTTTFEIAKKVKNKKITLITNSATIVSELINSPDSPIELVCIGGIFRANFRCFVGSDAEKFIHGIIPDIVFIAANGFSIKHGASTPMLIEGSVKKAMVASGKKVYLAIDSSKFDKDYLSVIAPPEKFDGIVTDKNVDQAIVDDLRKRGISIFF